LGHNADRWLGSGKNRLKGERTIKKKNPAACKNGREKQIRVMKNKMREQEKNVQVMNQTDNVALAVPVIIIW
jgi:hypothetical protein